MQCLIFGIRLPAEQRIVGMLRRLGFEFLR